MSGQEWLKELNDIDEKYIEEALQEYNIRHSMLKKSFVLVASFAVVLIGIGFMFNPFALTRNMKFAKIDGMEHYVELEKMHIEGYFWEVLTDTQNEELFPTLIEVFDISTTAHYSKKEAGIELVYIRSELLTSNNENIELLLSQNDLYERSYDELLLTSMNGIEVYGGYYTHIGDNKISCIVKFYMNDMYYSITSHDVTNTKEIEKLVGYLTKRDSLNLSILNPIPPETLINDSLTLEEACTDGDFGKFVPQELPKGYIFESISRMVNQEYNLMNISLTNGKDIFHWRISKIKEDEKVRITSVDEVKNYDLNQYAYPWIDAVPEERREIVMNPIFNIDGLSLDVVNSRIYKVEDVEDLSMNFSVLYDEILVEVYTETIGAEELFNMLVAIKE